MIKYSVMFLLVVHALAAETLTYKQRPLIELLEEFLPRHKTLILPQRAYDLEHMTKQMVSSLVPVTSQEEAWSLLQTYLAMSGFNAVDHNDQIRVVATESVKSGAVTREVLPLYTKETLDAAPTDDTSIRYIHYFKTMNADRLVNDVFIKMAKEMFSPLVSLVHLTSPHGVIITDSASKIKAARCILDALDAQGSVEHLLYVPLHFTSAPYVESAFNALKAASGDDERNKSFGSSDKTGVFKTYFTKDVQVVSYAERNGLFLLGPKDRCEEIADFITDVLDRSLDDGNSILHTYELNYIDARHHAPLLQRVISATYAAEQASQDTGGHLFRGVVIVAEPMVEKDQQFETQEVRLKQFGIQEPTGIDSKVTTGGNRLLIAAYKQDWLVIKAFLEKIDRPERQVLLEMVIVEFAADKRVKTAGTIRNKTDSSLLANGVEYLSSHVSPVGSVLGATPDQLAVDLLQVVGSTSVPAIAENGTVLFSFNDTATPGIFGLLELLDTLFQTQVRSTPYITVRNNKESRIESIETRRTTGDITTTSNGTFTIPIVDVPARLIVAARPRIYSNDKVQLTIGFTIEEFRGTTLNRLSRWLKTTAVLRSGQVLALGGFTRTETIETGSLSPLMGRIPLLGVFFRRNALSIVKRRLTLFVIPTIIEPRDPTGAWKKQSQVLVRGHQDLSSQVKLTDPLLRLFFTDDEQENVEIARDHGIDRLKMVLAAEAVSPLQR